MFDKSLISKIHLNDPLEESLIWSEKYQFNKCLFDLPYGQELHEVLQVLLTEVATTKINLTQMLTAGGLDFINLPSLPIVLKEDLNLNFPHGLYMGNIIVIYFNPSADNFLIDKDIILHEYNHNLVHQVFRRYKINGGGSFIDEALADLFTLIITDSNSISTLRNYDQMVDGNQLQLASINNIHEMGMLYCQLWFCVYNNIEQDKIELFLKVVIDSLHYIQRFPLVNCDRSFIDYYHLFHDRFVEETSIQINKIKEVSELIHSLTS